MSRPARSLSLLLIASLACPSVGSASTAAQTADTGATGPLADNQVEAIVKTPGSGFNRITVAVTICAPGSTTNCQRIENIMVDTGSTGLRVQRAAISPDVLGLPPLLGRDNVPLAECEHFSGKNNAAWGAIRTADVSIGHMHAPGLAIQIVNDDSVQRPSWCKNTARPTSNGTLGIGWRPRDPHTFVAVFNHRYTPLDPAIDANHLANPVAKFTTHNNGEVFNFRDADSHGEKAVKGTITFGIGTADNNRIDGAQYIPLDSNGLFTTTFDGVTFPSSYIDSGTPQLILADPALSVCDTASSYYYDDAATHRSASLQENAAAVALNAPSAAATPQGDPAVPVDVVVANRAVACRPVHAGVVGGIAEISTTQGKFVWGLPFFLGKRVFLVQQQAATDSTGKPVQRGQLYAVMAR